mmetsp:Transcript_80746/g.250636  ORF Transcript_80746/g.250636 Transcript_80746/m.250636 type:complete len:124 (+) Transcript_80746:277-648(+)
MSSQGDVVGIGLANDEPPNDASTNGGKPTRSADAGADASADVNTDTSIHRSADGSASYVASVRPASTHDRFDAVFCSSVKLNDWCESFKNCEAFSRRDTETEGPPSLKSRGGRAVQRSAALWR